MDDAAARTALAHAPFLQLWIAVLSAQGASATGSVIVPLLAIEVLGLTAAAIAIPATAAACAVLVAGMPTGAFAEFCRKRPILLHAHVWPGYEWEPAELVSLPVWLYPREHWSDQKYALGSEHDALRDELGREIRRLRPQPSSP